ncbi:MAG: hypothetical protein SH820_14905 [Xanthomonadales bacterium]|nr:hypothetical protein [Xanthomonadales bacterium]
MSDVSPIPDPDYDDPKEVYAFFGLTYYKAAVLEQGVVNLAVAMLAQNIPGVTVDDVDRLYESFDRKTFGHVINAAKSKFSIPGDLEDDLALALEQRNYLAHRFYVDHAESLMQEGGARKMIDELIGILKHLRSVDARMDPVWMAAWGAFGVTEEWIEKQVEKYRKHRSASDRSDV